MNFLSIENDITDIGNTFTDEELVLLGNFIYEMLENHEGVDNDSNRVATRLLHMIKRWEDEVL